MAAHCSCNLSILSDSLLTSSCVQSWYWEVSVPFADPTEEANGIRQQVDYVSRERNFAAGPSIILNFEFVAMVCAKPGVNYIEGQLIYITFD